MTPDAPTGAFRRELPLVYACLFLLFAGVTLLIPVLPALANRTGGANAAGAATAAFFLAAVASQIATPSLLRALPGRTVIALALLLSSLPCFVHALDPERLSLLLGTTAVRGVGFGLATVAAGTLVAEVAPSGRRGAALGLAGLMAGLPPVFAPAFGIFAFERWDASVVIVAAGVATAVGCGAAVLLPARAAARTSSLVGRLRAVVGRPLVLWPLLWFGLVSTTRGAVVTFVPIALVGDGAASAAGFLLVFGTASYSGRWLAGRLADRLGHERTVLPAVLLALAGLSILAADRSGASVVTAAALFGAGNGALMTASLLELLARGGDAGAAVPTAAWNVAIDLGFAVGGVALGVAAALVGLDSALWLLVGVMALVVLLQALGPPRGAVAGRASA